MQDTSQNALQSKTISLNNTLLHYHESGNGAPVVLLHGWGSNADSFLAVEKHLANHFRVFNLDLPGFGGSSIPASAWHLTDYVELVQAFITKLELTAPAVIGHSFGGRIAICLAAQNLVSKTLLVDSAGIKPRHKRLYYVKVYAYKAAKYCLQFAPAELRPILQDKLLQRFGSSDYRQAHPVMRQILVNVVNEDLTPLLAEIKTPTLLIWGENDTDTPLYQAKILEEHIADAGLVVLKNAGHFCFLDKPGEFNIIAEHFLQH